jgi:hypothetical protein
MDDDELREMRMQHNWDQQQAAMEEIRRLIAAEKETAIGEVVLPDKEIHDLMNQYGDTPIPEWEWMKLIAEAGRPINGPPMMISWIDDEGREERSTLSSQLFWFQAGWRASNMRTRLRIGGRETMIPNLVRLIGVCSWMQNHQQATPKDVEPEAWVEILSGYRAVELHAKRLIDAIQHMPKPHLCDDDDGG